MENVVHQVWKEYLHLLELEIVIKRNLETNDLTFVYKNVQIISFKKTIGKRLEN
jgi:hypothetical protein